MLLGSFVGSGDLGLSVEFSVVGLQSLGKGLSLGSAGIAGRLDFLLDLLGGFLLSSMGLGGHFSSNLSLLSGSLIGSGLISNRLFSFSLGFLGFLDLVLDSLGNGLLGSVLGMSSSILGGFLGFVMGFLQFLFGILCLLLGLLDLLLGELLLLLCLLLGFVSGNVSVMSLLVSGVLST